MIVCDPACYYLGALLLLLLPLAWVISFLAAALVHEFSHILAAWLFGAKLF